MKTLKYGRVTMLFKNVMLGEPYRIYFTARDSRLHSVEFVDGRYIFRFYTTVIRVGHDR